MKRFTTLWAAVAIVVLGACSTGTGDGPGPKDSGGAVTQPGTSSGAPLSGGPASTSTEPAQPKEKVRLSALQNDGTTWGIGMPIILYAQPAPTDSTAFTKNVTVTVNGQPADGSWYWIYPLASEKEQGIIQAHYRPRDYWPANSEIEVKLPLAGESAGEGLEYDGKLTSLQFRIGDARRSVVDAQALRMTVYQNDQEVRVLPVSLGKTDTPTYNGVKVVMQKGETDPQTGKLRPKGTVLMSGEGYTNTVANWSLRLTNSGEYLHSAPWNNGIGASSTSHGCTNMSPADAEWMYNFSQVGDVVEYAGSPGEKMPSWDGYGDWNIPWAAWKRGGELLNH